MVAMVILISAQSFSVGVQLIGRQRRRFGEQLDNVVPDSERDFAQLNELAWTFWPNKKIFARAALLIPLWWIRILAKFRAFGMRLTQTLANRVPAGQLFQ